VGPSGLKQAAAVTMDRLDRIGPWALSSALTLLFSLAPMFVINSLIGRFSAPYLIYVHQGVHLAGKIRFYCQDGFGPIVLSPFLLFLVGFVHKSRVSVSVLKRVYK